MPSHLHSSVTQRGAAAVTAMYLASTPSRCFCSFWPVQPLAVSEGCTTAVPVLREGDLQSTRSTAWGGGASFPGWSPQPRGQSTRSLPGCEYGTIWALNTTRLLEHCSFQAHGFSNTGFCPLLLQSSKLDQASQDVFPFNSCSSRHGRLEASDIPDHGFQIITRIISVLTK